MKGIVYETASGKVLYKFNTPGLPGLKVGEAIKQRDDIDNIQKDAIYNAGNNTYSNPAVVPDIKTEYAALTTDSQRIDFIAKKLGMKP